MGHCQSSGCRGPRLACVSDACARTHTHTHTHTHITSHHIISHHITSHHITSHHITSHHVTSHHITSHHIAYTHTHTHTHTHTYPNSVFDERPMPMCSVWEVKHCMVNKCTHSLRHHLPTYPLTHSLTHSLAHLPIHSLPSTLSPTGTGCPCAACGKPSTAL
jgi:hypothetical protein